MKCRITRRPSGKYDSIKAAYALVGALEDFPVTVLSSVFIVVSK